MKIEICDYCDKPVPLSDMTIDLTGGKREVFHLECWLSHCAEKTLTGDDGEDEITEDDCF